MIIKDRLPILISETMKAGNKMKLEALRAVKTAYMNWETAKENVGKTITDAVEITTTIALLHDVVEDTSITLADLAKQFPDEVIEALALLTHEKNEDYFEYVKRIKSNPYAKAVKLADLMHNSDITRLEVIDEKAQQRVAKYQRAIKLLSE